MFGVGSADKFIVRYVHFIHNTLYFACDFVNELFTRHALFGRLLLHFKAVLVGAGQKIYVLALQAVKARDSVRKNHLVGIADMRLARSVRYCGCYIKFFFHNQIIANKFAVVK